MSFLKRVARTLGDLLTSKKAIATISGIVAHQLGADPTVVQGIAAYVVGQGIADHGKGVQQHKMHTDAELADKLRQVREGKVTGSEAGEP